MGPWGICIAYGWLVTIIVIFSEFVQAIRKTPQPQILEPPQPQ